MALHTILAISGKPGLYRLVSRGKMNLIVETVDDKKRRIPAFSTDRITALSDIAMYTDAEDVPLGDVLESLKNLEEGKASSVDPKKASSAELREYFGKVLPDFDRERVHDSDIKKLLTWYNILIAAGETEFADPQPEAEAEAEENA